MGGAAQVVRETERKYEAAASLLLPAPGALVAGATAEPDDQVLVATYFDTADLQLASAGVTLRRREGGTDAGWHLKLPAGKDSRDELRLPLGRAGRRPPAKLVAMARVHTRGEPLGPVAELRTERRRWMLVDPSGREVVEVVDDHVSAHTMGAETTTLQWREIEVELVDPDDPALLDRIEEVLTAAGAAPSGSASKLAKLLGDRVTPVAPPRFGRKRSAARAVLAYLWTQAEALRYYDPRVRQNAPDAVHQMRVAARRMRSVLQAYSRIVDRERSQPLIEELRWLGGALADARDSEVMAERIDEMLAALAPELVLGPIRAAVTREFTGRHQEALTAGVAALDSERYLALHARIDAFFADPPLTDAADGPAAPELRRALRKALRRLRGRMATAESGTGEERDLALHEARKAAKRLRYAVEAAEPVLGKRATRLRKRLKDVQSVLGTHQDTVVARAELRALGARTHSAGLNTFTLGILHGAEAARAEAAERELPDVWDRMTASKVIGWLE